MLNSSVEILISDLCVNLRELVALSRDCDVSVYNYISFISIYDFTWQLRSCFLRYKNLFLNLNLDNARNKNLVFLLDNLVVVNLFLDNIFDVIWSFDFSRNIDFDDFGDSSWLFDDPLDHNRFLDHNFSHRNILLGWDTNLDDTLLGNWVSLSNDIFNRSLYCKFLPHRFL